MVAFFVTSDLARLDITLANSFVALFPRVALEPDLSDRWCVSYGHLRLIAARSVESAHLRTGLAGTARRAGDKFSHRSQ